MNTGEIMIVYSGFFALMLMMLACLRTNFAVELKSLLKTGGRVIWFFSNNKKPKEILPDKIDSKGVYLKNKGKQVMEFYPLKYSSWMPCGPLQKAIVFEGVSYPIDFRLMNLAAKVKKKGFPDYTQFEVACCLRRLEKELRDDDPNVRINMEFLNQPQELSQDGGDFIEYKRGMNWVKEQIVAMTGDQWAFAATGKEIKRALANNCYNADAESFSLLEDYRNWINRNASTHDVEDIITSIKVYEKEDAMFGKGVLGGLPAKEIAIILIAVGILYIMFGQGGGIGSLIPPAQSIIPSITTTTSPPINL